MSKPSDYQKMWSRCLFVVFDVESIGLYGEPFAVAWRAVWGDGDVLEEGILWCPLEGAAGSDEDRQWINENVAPHFIDLGAPSCDSPANLCSEFWMAWTRLKGEAEARGRKAIIAADVPYPVETRFLERSMKSHAHSSDYISHSPYPLLDVSSVMAGAGTHWDSPAARVRLSDEKPAHNPLCDVRQSARLLLMHLTGAGL